MLGVRIDDNPARSSAPAARCCERTRMGAVLITRGSRGMALFEPGRPTVHIPIFGSDEIADVTGAGDTVIADDDAGAGGGRARSTRRRAWPTTPAGWW